MRHKTRELHPPSTAHKAATQNLSRCRQLLDKYQADLTGLQDQLASVTAKIAEKAAAIEAISAEVVVSKEEVEKQLQFLR